MPSSTEKHRAFACAYLTPNLPTFFNRYRSMIASGYGKGYAKGNCHKILETRGIKKAIIEKQAQLDNESNIATPEEMLGQLTAYFRFDPIEAFIDEEGAMLPLNQISRSAAKCLTSFKIKETILQGNESSNVIKRTTEVKWSDRIQAIKTILDTMGLKNGNKEYVDRILKALFINIEISGDQVGDAVAGLQRLVDAVDGLTRGIPSLHKENVPKNQEVIDLKPQQ